jgi:hypothetical protein
MDAWITAIKSMKLKDSSVVKKPRDFLFIGDVNVFIFGPTLIANIYNTGACSQSRYNSISRDFANLWTITGVSN